MSSTGGNAAIEIVYGKVDFKQTCFDETTGSVLAEDLVRTAVMEELGDFSEKTVWAVAAYDEMKRGSSPTFVRMRRVLGNKGDEA